MFLFELDEAKVDGAFYLALNHIIVLSRNNFLFVLAELAWRIFPHHAFHEVVAKGRNVLAFLTHLQVLLFENSSFDRLALLCSDTGWRVDGSSVLDEFVDIVVDLVGLGADRRRVEDRPLVFLVFVGEHKI